MGWDANWGTAAIQTASLDPPRKIQSRAKWPTEQQRPRMGLRKGLQAGVETMSWQQLSDPENPGNPNASNGGDPCKHTVYLAVLDYLLARPPWSEQLRVRECHAGRGLYRVPADGRRSSLQCLYRPLSLLQNLPTVGTRLTCAGAGVCWATFGTSHRVDGHAPPVLPPGRASPPREEGILSVVSRHCSRCSSRSIGQEHIRRPDPELLIAMQGTVHHELLRVLAALGHAEHFVQHALKVPVPAEPSSLSDRLDPSPLAGRLACRRPGGRTAPLV